MITPRLSIDGVCATPKQVKVVPPKEKKKRVPPSVPENDEKHQRPTVAMLHDKIKTLIDYTQALQFRIVLTPISAYLKMCENIYTILNKMV